MAKRCKFLAVCRNGGSFSKWYESYCIDRFDAIAQMAEIYTVESEIEVVRFEYL